MALPQGVTKLGEFQGEKGEKGDQGERGPEGPRGLAGPNTVPTDDAVAGLLSEPSSDTRQALGPILAPYPTATAVQAALDAKADAAAMTTALQGKAAATHSHAGSDVTAATTSARGSVELATTTEASAASSSTLAVTPAGLAAYEAAQRTARAAAVADLRTGTDTTKVVTPKALADWRFGSVAAQDVMSRHSATGKPTSNAFGMPYGALVPGGTPNDWVVADGMLDVKDGFTAGYLELDHGRPVSRIGAEFSFDNRAGAKTTTGMLALIAWADGGIAANGPGRRTGMHIIVFSSGMVTVDARATVGTGTMPQVAKWDVPAFDASPSTVHRIDVFRNGPSLVIVIDGRTLMVTDPRIAPVEGENFACWEPYYPAESTAIRARIRNIWSDAEPMAPGLPDSEGRRATGAQQRMVHVIPEIASPPALTSSYVAIAGSQFTAQVGPSGRVEIELSAWITITTAATLRVRFGVLQDDGTTWAQHVAAHLAFSVQDGRVSAKVVLTGLKRDAPAQIRMEASGSGNTVITYSTAGNGRQAVITATPA